MKIVFAVLVAVSFGAAPARPQAKPAELRTIGPAVPLGAAQQAALAAKEARRTASAPAAVVRRKPDPRVHVITAPDPRAPIAPAEKLARWSAVSEAIGPVPRADWRHPGYRKRPDVTIQRPAAAAASRP